MGCGRAPPEQEVAETTMALQRDQLSNASQRLADSSSSVAGERAVRRELSWKANATWNIGDDSSADKQHADAEEIHAERWEIEMEACERLTAQKKDEKIASASPPVMMWHADAPWNVDEASADEGHGATGYEEEIASERWESEQGRRGINSRERLASRRQRADEARADRATVPAAGRGVEVATAAMPGTRHEGNRF